HRTTARFGISGHLVSSTAYEKPARPPRPSSSGFSLLQHAEEQTLPGPTHDVAGSFGFRATVSLDSPRVHCNVRSQKRTGGGHWHGGRCPRRSLRPRPSDSVSLSR